MKNLRNLLGEVLSALGLYGIVFGVVVCLMAAILLLTALTMYALSAEPSRRSCAALKVALEDLTTTQAQKTAEQLEIALLQMGMTEDGRSQVVVQALSPAVLRKIRAKYDPRLRGQVQAILMLAGCK